MITTTPAALAHPACIRVLIIGDEVLSRSVRETNLDYLLQRAAELYLPVDEVRIVRDDIAVIAAAMRQLAPDNGLLISSGGVGPTHDDVTLAAAARAFQAPLQLHPEMEGFLRARYGAHYADVAPMARLPQGTQVLQDSAGHWPLLRLGNSCFLPGLPQAFRSKLDWLLQSLPPQAQIHAGVLYVSQDESRFAEPLRELQRQHTHVEIGSYPERDSSGWIAKITLRGTSRPAVQAAFAAAAEYFRAHGWLLRHQDP